MALVKFSAMMATASIVVLVPTTASAAEREIGDRLQDAADPETGGKRQGARDEAAGKAAQQQRGEPDALHDGRIFVARKTEIDDERRGHRARQARR